jgi:hypothetical protein
LDTSTAFTSLIFAERRADRMATALANLLPGEYIIVCARQRAVLLETPAEII